MVSLVCPLTLKFWLHPEWACANAWLQVSFKIAGASLSGMSVDPKSVSLWFLLFSSSGVLLIYLLLSSSLLSLSHTHPQKKKKKKKKKSPERWKPFAISYIQSLPVLLQQKPGRPGFSDWIIFFKLTLLYHMPSLLIQENQNILDFLFKFYRSLFNAFFQRYFLRLVLFLLR